MSTWIRVFPPSNIRYFTRKFGRISFSDIFSDDQSDPISIMRHALESAFRRRVTRSAVDLAFALFPDEVRQMTRVFIGTKDESFEKPPLYLPNFANPVAKERTPSALTCFSST